MVPGLDVESLNTLGKLISRLERFDLEGAIPEECDLPALFDENEQVFFCIQGLASFWEGQAGGEFGQHIVDLVIGAHNQSQVDLTLIMLGISQKLSVYISLGTEKATRTLLEGIFPGITLEPVSSVELTRKLRPHFGTMGVMTGVPSHKTFDTEMQPGQNSARKQEQAPLERVIRGMYGATWAYIVQAHPRPRNKVVESRMKAIDTLTQVTSRSQVQWSAIKQDNQQFTTVESSGRTQSYSGNTVNYRAQYLTRLLERELERLDQAIAAGQWTVRTYFGAGNIDDTQRMASLLLGALSGASSRPEPLRTAICRRQGAPLENFHTFLTSREVATLIQFPREEVPGYAIHDYVRFDVDFQTSDTMTLPLGYIQQNGKSTQDTFNISLEALAKHAVVIGVTGSGKTTTVMNLLDCVVEAQKPFLVIEPAKTEYRSLHSAFKGRAELRVYTLGNEMVAPFRLNPFEFETDDEPGNVSLLTHIDFLKAVFNAAFPLYAPMPQILEMALYEVYEDKGWDITTGINRRLLDWSERHHYPIFPTLTDLYNKVEDVTNRLKYHDEIESNVKAALKARIGSLRIGSKGLMLDTTRGIPMQDLLSTPTILELENIGNDDEKTFLMGLLLAKLYEYRRLQAATGRLVPGLQHLIVFEEAHRLLKNTSTQVDSESSNPRAQAIEVFTNMLSEVRAYGQGVLVAEQIPSKLAPDVLKNTNLKIVHRLIAQDDRQSIGQTMNLNEQQLTHLGVLTPGMAAIYAEGADHAYLVRLENYKRKISPLVDTQLRQMSRVYASIKPFQAIKDIDEYDVPLAPLGGPDPATYQATSKLLDSDKSKWLWANILLRIVAAPSNMPEMLLRFSEHIEAEMSYLSASQHDALMRMVIVRGSAEIMYARGAQFGWMYPQVEELRVLLTRSLIELIRVIHKKYAEAEQDVVPFEDLPAEDLLERIKQIQSFQAEVEEVDHRLQQFADDYQTIMKRRQGPFVGCVHCPAKCLHRAEVSTLLSSKDQKWIIDEIGNASYTEMEERYKAVAGAATSIAQSWLGKEQEVVPAVSYCAVLHTVAGSDFTEYEQAMIGDNLKMHMFGLEE